MWAECTNNEWTLSTPQMTIDVGVIGPFEEGYLREKVSDRTFNLNVLNVADKDALQGVINGDKNGLFKVAACIQPSLHPTQPESNPYPTPTRTQKTYSP